MFKYYYRYYQLIKAISFFFIICLIFYFNNNFWIPINGGDLNFPFNVTEHLKGTLSTFNYRAFFGFENSREISSFVYAIIIYILSFFFENNYLITNFLILLGLFTGLTSCYIYLLKFNISSNEAILISLFWILNPIYLFIFGQIYFGGNIYLYLFLFFDVLILSKILSSNNLSSKILYILIFYFSPTNISFNNPALFTIYIPAIIYLLSLLRNFDLKRFAESLFIILSSNILHLYAIYFLIFGGNIGEASNELFIANSNIDVMKQSMASFFDAISMRGLWVTQGLIFQDYYNPYHFFFINPIYIFITYFPFIIFLIYLNQHTLDKSLIRNNIFLNNIKFIYISLVLIVFIYINSLHVFFIEIINSISQGIVQAFRSGMQKLGILIAVAYIPIFIYTIKNKLAKILLILFVFAHSLYFFGGNLYKKSFLQWPGSYFDIPNEYLELRNDENFNKNYIRYLSLPYNSDPNIEITTNDYSYSGGDFKFNLYTSSNIKHGDNKYFIEYAKLYFYLDNEYKIEQIIDYFNINYIFQHHDLSPIAIGIYDNGLETQLNYLNTYDIVEKNEYFSLYKTESPTNFFSSKVDIIKIDNFAEINDLAKGSLFVSRKNAINESSESFQSIKMNPTHDISKLTAKISINLDELDRDKNFIIHMTHRFSKHWKFKIENDDFLGASKDYIKHSRDVFGLNYWIFDYVKFCEINDCNDENLKILIFYENYTYLKYLLICLSLLGPILYFLFKNRLNFFIKKIQVISR